MAQFALHGENMGSVWMKFAIAHVIGDTVVHNKMCGRYGSYSNGKSLCCHCSCPILNLTINTFYNTPKSDNSAVDPHFKLFLPVDLIQDTHHDKDYFKLISHYLIENAFHKLEFGSTATPTTFMWLHQPNHYTCTSLEWKNKLTMVSENLLKLVLEALTNQHTIFLVGIILL